MMYSLIDRINCARDAVPGVAVTRRRAIRDMAAIAIASSSMFVRSSGAAPGGNADDANAGNAQTHKRVFITGSSAGLGLMAAKLLVEEGHRVVLHGRSFDRASNTLKELPGAEGAVYGDFTSLRQVRALAEQVNRFGLFDAIIHNAGIGEHQPNRVLTEDGFPQLFAINTLAPYVLTALIEPPKRLIYITSGMQLGVDGASSIDDLLWEKRSWEPSLAYSETKLHDTMFAFALARLWPAVYSNSVEPGWVPTRMGGSSASDDLNQGHLTQAWLAVSNDPQAKVSGRDFYHMALSDPNPDASRPELQDRLIAACAQLSGVSLPNLKTSKS